MVYRGLSHARGALWTLYTHGTTSGKGKGMPTLGAPKEAPCPVDKSPRVKAEIYATTHRRSAHRSIELRQSLEEKNQKVWWIQVCLGLGTNPCVILLVFFLLCFLDGSALTPQRFRFGKAQFSIWGKIIHSITKSKQYLLAHGQHQLNNKLFSVGVCF